MSRKGDAVETLALDLYADGYDFVREYVFAPPRKWRFDFAIVDKKIAIEVDGGSWIGGRHTSGAGFMKDLEKFNAATTMGWKVLRYTPRMIEAGVLEDVAKVAAR